MNCGKRTDGGELSKFGITLQWSRKNELRKTSLSPGRAITSASLQWSRKNELRKTQKIPLKNSLFIGFNGAARMNCGKRDGNTPPTPAANRLQWSRKNELRKTGKSTLGEILQKLASMEPQE